MLKATLKTQINKQLNTINVSKLKCTVNNCVLDNKKCRLNHVQLVCIFSILPFHVCKMHHKQYFPQKHIENIKYFILFTIDYLSFNTEILGYHLFSNADCQGGNIDSEMRVSAMKCSQHCRELKHCVGFTYSGKDSQCMLKSKCFEAAIPESYTSDIYMKKTGGYGVFYCNGFIQWYGNLFILSAISPDCRVQIVFGLSWLVQYDPSNNDLPC